MKKMLCLLILVAMASFCHAGLMEGYSILVSYSISGGAFGSISETALTYYTPSIILEGEEGYYYFLLMDDKNNSLDIFPIRKTVLEVSYAPSPDWFDENGTQIYTPNETLEIIDTYNETVYIPYYSEIDRLLVIDNRTNSTVLSYDLSEYKMEREETANNTPSNSNQSGYQKPAEPENKGGLDIVAIAAVVLAIGAVSLLAYLMMKGRNKR